MATGSLCTHGIVVGELSLGCGEMPRRIAAQASALRPLRNVPDGHVLEFSTVFGLSCSGLGWSDACLLASAALSEVPVTIHTRDRAMAAAAARLGLGPAGP